MKLSTILNPWAEIRRLRRALELSVLREQTTIILMRSAMSRELFRAEAMRSDGEEQVGVEKPSTLH